MPNYATPDIYFEQIVRDERSKALEIARMNVPAFLGVAEKGAIQTPTRVTSWDAFKRLFGSYSPNAFLAFSVYGFFNNGGDECYVTRVAHVDDEDPDKNASRASTVLKDLYSRGTIQLDALNEGTWANKLRVSVGVPKRVHRTVLLADVVPGATRARVDVARGFEVGSTVRFTDGKQEGFARITKVEGKEIFWEKPLDVKIPEGKGTAESVEFKLTITGETDFEIFDNLSIDPEHSRYFVKALNEGIASVNSGNPSQFVRVKDLRSSTQVPYNLPQAMTESVLEGGRDGTEYITAEDYIGFSKGPTSRRGIRAYEENDDIALICMPDLMKSAIESRGFHGEKDVEAVQKAAIDFCTANRYCFVILDPPPQLTPVLVQEWRDKFDSKFAAIYYPWIKVIDPFGKSGQTMAVPPCGHVAGIYAKLDDREGCHRAPANEPINDVISLERNIDKDAQDLIYPDGINCIRAFRGRGIRIWGARTLASDTQWRHVNVARVFAMISKSIENGTQWAPFEPNGPDLWKQIGRLVGFFLLSLWRKGYLIGETPEQAFYVKCDDETNPPESREAGEVVCEIGLAIVRPLEFMVFRIGQRTKDITTEEPE